MQAPPPGTVDPTNLGAAAASQMREAGSFFSQSEFALTLILFIFGVIAILAFYFLARSEKGTPFIMRIYVIIVIVFGTLLIVSSSYTTQQIAPVVGLFGTIAGYLLGRSEKSNEGDK